MNSNINSKNQEFRQGVMVLLFLAVMTIVEYILGISSVPAIFMFAMILLKASVVLWYFMHIRRVFRPDEGGHE